jgi:uncharacterized lipoprotein NlpE involved in copper resistance
MGKSVLILAIGLLAGLNSCQNQASDNAATTAGADAANATAPATDTVAANNAADTSVSPRSIVSETTPSNFSGVYRGTLPCADCEGIETELTLSTDKTYSIARKYLGKGDDNSVLTNGRWEWMSNNAMKLNDPAGPPTLIYVMDGKVLMLDRSGNRINGSLADKYYLYKAK